MNSKVFCDEIIGLVTGASATGKDFHMVTLDDERQEEQSLKRRVTQIKAERSSLDTQLSQLEGELAVVEDGARAREASNINNALSLLKIHFSEFADNRSKVEQAQEEIDRLRDLVEKTSELCMRESTEAKAWKEKYRQLAKSKAAAGAEAVEAASPPPPHQAQPLPIQAFGIDCVSTGSAHLPGALVTAVHTSSAVSSQLTPGDIIVEAAGRTVAAPEDLRSVPHTALHSDMDVTVLRRKCEVLKISSAAKPAARATRLRFTRNVTSAEHATPAPAHEASDEKPKRSTLTNASPPAGSKDLINVHRGSVHVAPPPDLRTSDLRNESPEVEVVEAPPAAPVAPAAAAASPTPPAAKPVIPLLSLPAAAPSKHTTHHAKVPRKVTKAAHGTHKK